MYKFYKLLFLLTLVLGTLITISSYSWMTMWMGLEINLLSIIPLMKDNKNNQYTSEAALKYFIIQALASNIFLLAVILTLTMSEGYSPNSFLFPIMTNSALLTKMGAAPFHFWFPEVMEGLNWLNSLLMLTWQKIAPMVLVFLNIKMTFFLYFIIVSSSIVSGIQGINQISLRKILSYSSINHIGWMLASMLHSQSIWLFYFTIYSIITLNIVLIFFCSNIFFLNQLFSIMPSNKMMKFFFMMNFLSLGGLPPFLGFFPKWLVINNLTQNNFFLLSFILITFTLLTLFFYLRITFSSLMINSTEQALPNIFLMNSLVSSFNLLSLLGLVICTLSFNFF